MLKDVGLIRREFRDGLPRANKDSQRLTINSFKDSPRPACDTLTLAFRFVPPTPFLCLPYLMPKTCMEGHMPMPIPIPIPMPVPTLMLTSFCLCNVDHLSIFHDSRSNPNSALPILSYPLRLARINRTIGNRRFK